MREVIERTRIKNGNKAASQRRGAVYIVVVLKMVLISIIKGPSKPNRFRAGERKEHSID